MSKLPVDLAKALHLVEQWSTNWQFTIQPTKSEHISFYLGDNLIFPNFKINNSKIN